MVAQLLSARRQSFSGRHPFTAADLGCTPEAGEIGEVDIDGIELVGDGQDRGGIHRAEITSTDRVAKAGEERLDDTALEVMPDDAPANRSSRSTSPTNTIAPPGHRLPQHPHAGRRDRLGHGSSERVLRSNLTGSNATVHVRSRCSTGLTGGVRRQPLRSKAEPRSDSSQI